MPAVSICEPAATLRRALDAGQSKEELSSSLVTNASRILQSEVQYKEVNDYQTAILDQLKAKYIVLSLPNGEDERREAVKRKSPCLPEPAVTLFPLRKVALGWRGTFPVGAGMFNGGNTCYLNSTLQALFHVPALVNWLLSDSHHNTKCDQNDGGAGECLTCAMAKTLQFSHQKSGCAIKPFYIYNKLKLICRTMVPGQQEDAHEFLRFLLDGMKRSYLARHTTASTKLDNLSKETTPINQIFGGYLRTEVKCLQCRHVSTTFQHFQDLLVDVRKATTLDEALATYFSREHLENNDYRCEACKRRVPATKQFSIESPPKVLCVQLKRFNVLGGKISKHVAFKQTVDLSPYLFREPGDGGGRIREPGTDSGRIREPGTDGGRMREPSAEGGRVRKPLTYRLASIVTHVGPSVNCGHYTAVARVSTGQYYSFDDSCVRPLTINNVLSTNAYIMFFELENNGGSVKGKNEVEQQVVEKVNKPSTSTGLNVVNGTVNSNNNGIKKRIEEEEEEGLRRFSGLQEKQPRLIMQIKNGKVFNGNLVPYDGSSEEEEENEEEEKEKKEEKVVKKRKENGKKCNGSGSSYAVVKYQNGRIGKIGEEKSGGGVRSVNGWQVSRDVSYGGYVQQPNGWNVVVDKEDSKPPQGTSSTTTTTTTTTTVTTTTTEVNASPASSSNGITSATISSATPTTTTAAVISTTATTTTTISTAATTTTVTATATTVASSTTPSAAAVRNFNGTNQSDTVSQLLRMSLRRYGNSVTNWNGNRTLLDREVDADRREERKRHSNDEEELDRGRVKRSNGHRGSYGGGNEDDDRGNYGNPFQDYQEGKTWPGRRYYDRGFRHYYNTTSAGPQPRQWPHALLNHLRTRQRHPRSYRPQQHYRCHSRAHWQRG